MSNPASALSPAPVLYFRNGLGSLDTSVFFLSLLPDPANPSLFYLCVLLFQCSVPGCAGCVSSGVLVAGEGADGVGFLQEAARTCPSSKSDSSLSKAEQINNSVYLKRGGKAVAWVLLFGDSCVWDRSGTGERKPLRH